MEKTCLKIPFSILQLAKKAKKAIFWSRIHFFVKLVIFVGKLLSFRILHLAYPKLVGTPCIFPYRLSFHVCTHVHFWGFTSKIKRSFGLLQHFNHHFWPICGCSYLWTFFTNWAWMEMDVGFGCCSFCYPILWIHFHARKSQMVGLKGKNWGGQNGFEIH